MTNFLGATVADDIAQSLDLGNMPDSLLGNLFSHVLTAADETTPSIGDHLLTVLAGEIVDRGTRVYVDSIVDEALDILNG